MRRGLGRGLDSIFGSGTRSSLINNRDIAVKNNSEPADDSVNSVKNGLELTEASAKTGKGESEEAYPDNRNKLDSLTELNNLNKLDEINKPDSLNEIVGHNQVDELNTLDQADNPEQINQLDQLLRHNGNEGKSEGLIQHMLSDGGQVMVKTNLIQPNENQPRRNFEEESLSELANSIKTFGIIQPLIVKKQGAFYELVAGERRWRAARKAGLSEVPVIIREMDEQTSREIALIENIQRADLSAVEEARAYQSLINDYGLTQEEVADRVSKNRSTITNSLRLLKLEPEILEMLERGKLKEGHARALLGVEDSETRMELAEQCIEKGLSVREIEKLARNAKAAAAKAEEERKKLEAAGALDSSDGSGQGAGDWNAESEKAEAERLKILYQDLEQRLKIRLGTKVSIVAKNKDRGKLEIEYYSQEDLDRLFTLLNS